MATAAEARNRTSVVELIRDLAVSSSALVRNEAKLVRLEVSNAGSAAAKGSALIAVGGVLALLGALASFTGIILLIGDQWLPRDMYWLGALIVLAVSGGLAALLARRGLANLKPSSLAPDQTIETLKEDAEWLKRRMTSDAT